MKKKRNTLPKFKGNFAAALIMRKALQRKLRQLHNEAEETLIDSMESDIKNKAELIDELIDKLIQKWGKSFEKLANELSQQMLTSVANHIDTQFIKIDKSYKVHRGKERITQVKKAILKENINLIKSIPADVLNKYGNIFMNAIGNFDQHSVVRQLRQVTKLNERRIKLIARDQVSKAITRYQMSRSQGLGFEYYVWHTVLDERVSTGDGGHKALEGRIYRYDTPTAIIDANNNKGIPSQRPNCRCVALALITDDTTQLKLIKDKKHGDYYIIL